MRSPAPGKLSAIEKWERPQTFSELRAFLCFTNYYNSYVNGYAEVVAKLQDTLNVPCDVGKKGFKVKILCDAQYEKCFQKLKHRL
jgi:hypothetical protein